MLRRVIVLQLRVNNQLLLLIIIIITRTNRKILQLNVSHVSRILI